MTALVTAFNLLKDHPFLAGVPEPWLERLSYRASRSFQHAGSRLFREGDRADRFWLIRDGRVALDLDLPGRGIVTVEELGPGSVLGWSWLFPPYRWHFSAVAVTDTLAVVLDGAGVRRLCDEDPALGLELTRRFTEVLIERLQTTRMRLLELPATAT